MRILEKDFAVTRELLEVGGGMDEGITGDVMWRLEIAAARRQKNFSPLGFFIAFALAPIQTYCFQY